MVTTRSSPIQSYRPQRHCFAFRDLDWTWRKQRLRSPEDFSDDDKLDVDADGQLDPNISGGANNRNNNNGKAQTLEFSSFADSCRRNVALGREGDFAFNLTRIGE